VDPGAFTDATILEIALGVTALAVLGKLIGGGIASAGLPPRSAAIIGTGMVPRGEVGLVVASVGSGIGAISTDMFSVVVFMSVATTILAPPVLVWLHRGYPLEPLGEPAEPALPEL
jgi:Kef-type K+ transport system membrane component KefB